MMSTTDTKAPAPKKVKLTTSSMIASIAAEGQATKPAPFGHALVAAAKENPKILGMTADLGKYTDLHIFKQAFPDRFYQMGMAEQLLFGAAAGLAHEGFIPFATTYAVFASRRAYDFIHQTIAEENLPVKIAAALPGLTSGYGPSHQAAEDLALFRAMPNMTVIDPCDALEIEQAVPAMIAHDGPVYMRLLRGKVPLVLDEYGYTFELGKAKVVRDGSDVLVISTGLATMRALETAKALEADKVSVGGAARADDQAARHRDDPRGSRPQRPHGRRRREPHGDRRPRRGGGGRASARRRGAEVPPHRPARRVPRRRCPADAARPLRHLRHGNGCEHKGLALSLARGRAQARPLTA